MSNYNYGEFSTDTYNLDQFHGPELGSKAPDFELSTADGKQASLRIIKAIFFLLSRPPRLKFCAKMAKVRPKIFSVGCQH